MMDGTKDMRQIVIGSIFFDLLNPSFKRIKNIKLLHTTLGFINSIYVEAHEAIRRS